MGQSLRRFNNQIHRFPLVSSTNDVARELADSGAEEGTTVVAEAQSAGRGRLGRSWVSPKGEGLYHSIILRPKVPATDAPLVNLVIAVAIAEAIHEGCQLAVDIKWPNDLLIEDRKLSGILTELKTINDGVDYIIAGIGINVNQMSFPPELGQAATSLRLVSGRPWDIERIRGQVYSRLDRWYDSFLTGGSQGILDRWCQLSSYAFGKLVRVVTGDRSITGLTRGLTPKGELLIETPLGGWETILAGDVQGLRASE
jgi:BirA family biotin operon repressor/biotin-[acetyl-CoA-carboxylase] ligase